MEKINDEKTNNNDDESVSHDIIMAKERIHNPKTGSDYRIRQKSTKKGRKGQIIGRWTSRKSE